MNNDIFSKMAASWGSPVIARTEVGRFSGGLLSPKSLANYDCQGIGPEGRFRIGRKICYPVPELIIWLRARTRPVDPKGGGSILD